MCLRLLASMYANGGVSSMWGAINLAQGWTNRPKNRHGVTMAEGLRIKGADRNALDLLGAFGPPGS